MKELLPHDFFPFGWMTNGSFFGLDNFHQRNQISIKKKHTLHKELILELLGHQQSNKNHQE